MQEILVNIKGDPIKRPHQELTEKLYPHSPVVVVKEVFC